MHALTNILLEAEGRDLDFEDKELPYYTKYSYSNSSLLIHLFTHVYIGNNKLLWSTQNWFSTNNKLHTPLILLIASNRIWYYPEIALLLLDPTEATQNYQDMKVY